MAAWPPPRWLRPQSYNGLLGALMVLVLVQPLIQQAGTSQWLFDVVLALVLAGAIFEIAGDRRGMWIAALLGFPALTGRVLSAAWEQPPHAIVAVVFAFTIAFLATVLGAMLRHILTTEEVSADTLRGAICVYLLIGITWAIAYRFLLFLDPQAFSFAEHLSAHASDHGRTGLLNYFSFVTLTTLGYGDISPITPLARTLAWCEAMAGQLFMAITIARLVGLHIARRAAHSND